MESGVAWTTGGMAYMERISQIRARLQGEVNRTNMLQHQMWERGDSSGKTA